MLHYVLVLFVTRCYLAFLLIFAFPIIIIFKFNVLHPEVFDTYLQ